MRNDTTVFVGLDVHKDSIVAAYSIGAGEIQDLGNVGVLQRDLDRLCTRMRSKGSRLRFVYEAGPYAYGVYRHLTAKGFECTVCAPSLIVRKPGDRVKTDRRDDLKQAKQRLKSFLLVHDVRYTGKANWNEAHRRWLARFVFAHANSHLAFQEHLHSIDDRLAQCERLAYRYPPKVSPSIRKRHDGISRLLVDRAGTRSCVCANAFASLRRTASPTTLRWWRSPANCPASSGTSHGCPLRQPMRTDSACTARSTLLSGESSLLSAAQPGECAARDGVRRWRNHLQLACLERGRRTDGSQHCGNQPANISMIQSRMCWLRR